MKLPVCLLVGALIPSLMTAAQDGDEGGSDSQPKAHWLSFLVPKTFDRNPKVDFNVITEMTDAGRELAPPSPEEPVFYRLHQVGYLRRGQGAPAREATPPPDLLMEAMQNALAANGYRIVAEDERAELLVVFYWGSYTSAGWDAEAGNAETDGPPRVRTESSDDLLPLVLSDLAKREELLERAALVGGLEFAGEMQQVLNKEVDYEDVRINESRLAEFMSGAGGVFVGGTTLGGAVGGDVSNAFNSFNPFYRFKNRNARTRYLVEQAFGSFYFVVASAYELASVARDERVLLWRTKMTVNSNGVAMTETLRPMIASAGPYFGVEMKGTATVPKQLNRNTSVEFGPTEVIEYLGPEGSKPSTQSENVEASAATEAEVTRP